MIAVDTPTSQELRSFCQRGTTLRGREIVDVSLRDAVLDRLRADGLTLREVDLRGASLRAVEWLNCTLTDVRMAEADGRGAIVRMSSFERVHAAGCDLSGAKIEDCEAQGIVLEGARLTGASLMETDFTRATLRGANLRDVDASGAVFRGADLRDADLGGANFEAADLRGADLRGAVLDDAELGGADLRGALFEAADAASDPVGEDQGASAGPEVESPLAGDLVSAVGPIVIDVLQRGKQRGVVDEATLQRLLDDVGRAGVDPALGLDGALQQVLTRVGSTGITPLLAALRQGDEQPPPEIAELITALMADAELGAEATAEDLVVHLLQHLQSSVASE